MSKQIQELPFTNSAPANSVVLIKYATGAGDPFDYQITVENLLGAALTDSDFGVANGKPFKLTLDGDGAVALPTMSGKLLTGVIPPTADALEAGIVQLSDSTSSSSDVDGAVAATPKAVKTVADAKFDKAGGTISGTVDLADSITQANNKAYRGKIVAGTAYAILWVNTSDEVEVGNTDLPTVIYSSVIPKTNINGVGEFNLLHEGKMGSGSGIDADKLRGVNGNLFMRNDSAQSLLFDFTATNLNASGSTTGNVGVKAVNADGAGSASLQALNGVDGGVEVVANSSGQMEINQVNSAGALEKRYLFGARDGTVHLFYNGATKIETTSSGVLVTGNMIQSGSTLQTGGSTTAGLYVTSSVCRYKNSDIVTAGSIGSYSINAQTVDGINGASLLRSDADDSFSGNLTGTGHITLTSHSFYTNSWFRSTGATGWINETYGGGVYMIDSTYVRTYGSKKFYVNNEIMASGNIIAGFSDRRLKTRVTPLADSEEFIMSLDTVTYEANKLAKSLSKVTEGRQTGLFTDQIKVHRPELVSLAAFDRTENEGESLSGENYETTDYAKIVPDLVNLVQQLTLRIRELEAK